MIDQNKAWRLGPHKENIERSQIAVHETASMEPRDFGSQRAQHRALAIDRICRTASKALSVRSGPSPSASGVTIISRPLAARARKPEAAARAKPESFRLA